MIGLLPPMCQDEADHLNEALNYSRRAGPMATAKLLKALTEASQEGAGRAVQRRMVKQALAELPTLH